jgi:hypothetical protein
MAMSPLERECQWEPATEGPVHIREAVAELLARHGVGLQIEQDHPGVSAWAIDRPTESLAAACLR